MKKVLSIVLVLCIMLSLCAMPVMAQEAVAIGQMQTKDIITITVDGRYVDCASYGQLPVIVEGRTLVPLRSVFEALGATVEWHNETRSARSVRGEDIVVLAIDSKVMLVNGNEKALDVSPQIMNERTMVPVRAIAEAFGCKVEWNNDTRTVVIVTVTQEQEVSVAEGTPEAAVAGMWNAFKAGDFEGAAAYFAYDLDIKAAIKEAFVGEPDLSNVTAQQSEKIDNITAKLINIITGCMSLEIVNTSVISEKEANVQVVMSMPDISSIDMDGLVIEELLASNGYTLDALATMTEEEQIVFYTEVVINLTEYMCELIEQKADTLPIIKGEPTDIRVSFIDNKWLILE